MTKEEQQRCRQTHRLNDTGKVFFPGGSSLQVIVNCGALELRSPQPTVLKLVESWWSVL